MKGYEVVIIWSTGKEEIYKADAIVEAGLIKEGFKAAFGSQIKTIGIREGR